MIDTPQEIAKEKISYEERELWTTGRRGCVACVQVAIYPHSIVATAEPDHITERMMKKALNREFPRHIFYFSNIEWHHRADADRWTNDGVR